MHRAETHFKVLIVTDNNSLISSVQEYCAGSRYSAAACSGRSGIIRTVAEAIRKNAIDIVIIDIVMLVYAGRELIRAVRKADGRPDIILITGQGSASMEMEYMKKDVHDFIPRPVDRDHLLMLIDQAAERRLHWHIVIPGAGRGFTGASSALRVSRTSGANQYFLCESGLDGTPA